MDDASKTFDIPEERSWTIAKNGRSIWDMDDNSVDDELTDVERDLEQSTLEFSQGIAECRRLLKHGQTITDSLKRYL